jgi:hypothetical protein
MFSIGIRAPHLAMAMALLRQPPPGVACGDCEWSMHAGER